jgi:hypothetical protein
MHCCRRSWSNCLSTDEPLAAGSLPVGENFGARPCRRIMAGRARPREEGSPGRGGAIPMLRPGRSVRPLRTPFYRPVSTNFKAIRGQLRRRRTGRAPVMEKMAGEGAAPAMEKMAGRGPSRRPPAPRSRRRRGQRRRGRSKPVYLGLGVRS